MDLCDVGVWMDDGWPADARTPTWQFGERRFGAKYWPKISRTFPPKQYFHVADYLSWSSDRHYLLDTFFCLNQSQVTLKYRSTRGTSERSHQSILSSWNWRNRHRDSQVVVEANTDIPHFPHFQQLTSISYIQPTSHLLKKARSYPLSWEEPINTIIDVDQDY